MKSIHKIVLTGGPCAGKSTSLSRIQSEFTEMGYKVFVVSESATSLIGSGAFPDGINISNMNFQKALMRKQIQEEQMYFDLGNDSEFEKILIVCDRGAMDAKAYCSEPEFKHLLDTVHIDEVNLRDSYDGIFHLRTSAYGAEEFYTLENNSARTESAEQARNLDDQIVKAWTGHPHLRIIDNSSNFETKIKRLIAEVLGLLGEPVPFEIEKKFIVKKPSIEILEELNAKKIQIIQTYLRTESLDEERIRQRGSAGNYVFFHTIKKFVSEEIRIETERRITKNQYLDLLMFSDTKKRQIRKDRWCFVHKNDYFELDIFQDEDDYALLEIELNDTAQNFEIPKLLVDLGVLIEVTNNPNFKNDSIATSDGLHVALKTINL